MIRLWRTHSYRSCKVFADQPMKIFDTNINIKDFWQVVCGGCPNFVWKELLNFRKLWLFGDILACKLFANSFNYWSRPFRLFFFLPLISPYMVFINFIYLFTEYKMTSLNIHILGIIFYNNYSSFGLNQRYICVV